MTTNSSILACDALGTRPSLSQLPCCHINDQDSPTCRRLFPPTLKQGMLGRVCLNQPDSICPLFLACSDVSSLYTSLEQTEQTGDGLWLIKRYVACANMPTIATAAYAGELSRNISSVVTNYIPPLPKLNAFETRLQQITSAVTDCLSSTCRASRDVDFCYEDHCSPTKLLTNGTLPNLEGINDCLFTLCNADNRALPWPDADVIGIGVFISYMMQCALVVCLWAGLLFFSIQQHRATTGSTSRTPSPQTKKGESSHLKALRSLLLDFHKSQCYFAGTLMLASAITIFSSGDSSSSRGIDIVITFMILPLATNSIVPVVFAYLLLVYFTPKAKGGDTRRPAVSVPITILTGTVYILSSIIFWTLYSELPLQTKSGTGIGDADDMYRLYRLQLSSLPACGGYSGLAACPFESKQRATAVEQGLDARKKLRVLTPIIWGWSTFVFLGLVGMQVYHAIMSGRGSARRALQGVVTHVDGQSKQAGFWLTTLGFLAGVGMQLAVLWTAKLLGMVNDRDWGFGQIVAVTIWIPPLLEYFFEEIGKLLFPILSPCYNVTGFIWSLTNGL
ncbi:hypothetical protein QBC37DRAFT_298552 [Rhypophila decipiens]|uniref:Uncharacterized protein n=1 Tax=Rhypophila decipiens TaxID=261697 RepID=A0AAN6XXJ4_9PEZI|nr:hypothetical protein QBC37DRAFT_298552 [Rhypophila decipiens]